MALTKVTSAGIVDDTIAESKLDIHAAPSGTDKYLKYTSNGMEWTTVAAGGISDIVSDTSPQLGGDLDTNSFEISLDDDHKVKFGDGSDLEIYHNGTNSYIVNGTGDLYLYASNGNDFYVCGQDGHTLIKGNDGGSVELFYDNSKKIETTSLGVNVTGDQQWSADGASADELHWDASAATLGFKDNIKALFGTGDDLQIYANGSNSIITHNGDGNLIVEATGSGEDLYLQAADIVYIKTNSETSIRCVPDGAVELYYDNVKKFHTVSDGAIVSGHLQVTNSNIYLNDNGELRLGDTGDLQIYHDGTDNYFDQVTGYLRIRDVANSREIAKFHSTNSQEFYMNGTKRLEVTNTGISVTGSVTPSGGIYLGGSGGGNYLSDYEKGTWTPGLANDSGTAFSATVSEAHYTKIGRLVNIFLYWSSMANIPNNGSSFQITGLPFANDGAHHGWGQIGYAATHDCAHWNPLVTTDGTNIYFHRTDGSGSTPANSDWTGCTHFILQT